MQSFKNLLHLKPLKEGKNLLAFSYGSDSTALFYALQNEGVAFDLALVNYGTRMQSDEEEKSAKNLAQNFNKQIFTTKAPKFKGNFEAQARAFRYEFFEKICQEKGYKNLILAHQLNDKFEWFLMQFAKGAGLLELVGMQSLEKRANFTLLRPFLATSKEEILAFLEQNGLFYFKDSSNDEAKYLRNAMRLSFSNAFMKSYAKGVKKSFEYLQNEANLLYEKQIKEFEGILYCEKKPSLIARALKQKGLCISAKQRAEMMRNDCVVSGKMCVCFYENLALIFAYEKAEISLPKTLKERYRKAKIPKFLRGFLFSHQIDENALLDALQNEA